MLAFPKWSRDTNMPTIIEGFSFVSHSIAAIVSEAIQMICKLELSAHAVLCPDVWMRYLSISLTLMIRVRKVSRSLLAGSRAVAHSYHHC
mgnify:CR=1 FL=1